MKDWLSSQEHYALLKKSQRNFKRQRIIVGEKNNSVHSDTLNMKKFAKFNEDYGFILVVVEVLTRFAYTRPLKTLQAADTKEALEDIFKEAPKPDIFFCDGGAEYLKSVKVYLKEQGIKKVVSRNETKAFLAERYIQTLRLHLERYFRAKDTRKWLDVLEPMTAAYNHTRHRSLGGDLTPFQAMCDTPTPLLYHWQYRRKPQEGPIKEGYTYNIGDRVRLSVLRKSFHRRYDENFTREIFHVYSREKKQGFELYRIKDEDNEPVDGVFYVQELQLVPDNYQEGGGGGGEEDDESSLKLNHDAFEVEHVLKIRMSRGLPHKKKIEYLVKWKGR